MAEHIVINKATFAAMLDKQNVKGKERQEWLRKFDQAGEAERLKLAGNVTGGLHKNYQTKVTASHNK